MMYSAMKEIIKKSDKELAKALTEAREKLRSIRFEGAGARTANTSEAKNLRKHIAQILTEINKRRTQA